MSDRQCPSCGGICRKSGCERANLDHDEWDIRGELAAALKCWHRLTGEEAAELVAFVAALKAPLLHNAELCGGTSATNAQLCVTKEQ